MENNVIIKKQLLWTQLCAALLAVILVMAIVFVLIAAPRLSRLHDTFQKLDGITDDLAEISGQLKNADWQSISADMAEVSAQLLEVNWTELSGNINGMAEDAQKSMNAALEAIDRLDIDSLNKAIKDISTVIEPLVEFAGRFS